MSSDKRQFSNFTKFQGNILNESGEYAFPVLYHKDSNDNMRMWKINIRLIKGNINKTPTYKIDWDVMKDNTIPIIPSYLNNIDIPANSIAQMWVETGVINGKISRHIPTYPKPKNIGKKNERNSLEQALVLSRSQFLKKINMGLTTTPNKNVKINASTMYFPMLVHKYENEKKRLNYPLYVQPKLDGARVIAFLTKKPQSNPTYKDVKLYTRQKKEYIGFDSIRKDLLEPLCDLWNIRDNESIYVDGEFYKHGMNLQIISGAVRNPKRKCIKKYKGIKFHVFDAFYPSNNDDTFQDRINILNDLFELIDSSEIVLVKTMLVKNEKDQELLYNKYLKKEYEGTILRNVDSLYLTSPTNNSSKIRSKFVLKRKPKFRDEFEIVGFNQGTKGRDIGAIIWQCKLHDSDKTFTATPNIPYDERYKLFKLLKKNKQSIFISKYKNRMMTIEYEDLSTDGTPLRAKSVGFREHI